MWSAHCRIVHRRRDEAYAVMALRDASGSCASKALTDLATSVFGLRRQHARSMKTVYGVDGAAVIAPVGGASLNGVQEPAGRGSSLRQGESGRRLRDTLKKNAPSADRRRSDKLASAANIDRSEVGFVANLYNSVGYCRRI